MIERAYYRHHTAFIPRRLVKFFENYTIDGTDNLHQVAETDRRRCVMRRQSPGGAEAQQCLKNAAQLARTTHARCRTDHFSTDNSRTENRKIFPTFCRLQHRVTGIC